MHGSVLVSANDFARYAADLENGSFCWERGLSLLSHCLEQMTLGPAVHHQPKGIPINPEYKFIHRIKPYDFLTDLILFGGLC